MSANIVWNDIVKEIETLQTDTKKRNKILYLT
jgi:hypothetical protein